MLNNSSNPPSGEGRNFAFAVLFELSLGVLGLGIAWAASLPVTSIALPNNMVRALTVGIIAGLMLLPLLHYLLHSSRTPVIRLRNLITRVIGDLLGRASWWQLLIISLAAGIGEEILFRGAIQPVAINLTGPVWGIAIASLLFGAVHAATPTYFVLATLIGAYFGILAWWQQEILSAAIAHALYDFVALLAIFRTIAQSAPST